MKEDLKKILKENNYKVTPTRLAILEMLSNESKPIDAKILHSKLKKTGIDLATIHRTLSTFEKSGIVRKVDLHKDSIYFEINDTHHHHIVCTECGLIEDFDECLVEKSIKTISSHSLKFKTIRDHSLEFFGSCKSCESVRK